MVMTVTRGRRGQLRPLPRPRRPLLVSSAVDESLAAPPPTRSPIDEAEDPQVQESPEAVPEVGQQESNDVQDDGNQGDIITVIPIKKRGQGPAKGTAFEKLRKLGKIPLIIKDGHRGPSCDNAAVFSSRVSWVVKVHAEMRHASWSAVDEKEKHELINRVKADFVLDWTKENHREAVVTALADKYNAYHYELHKHYLKYASHEEALSGGMSLVEKPIWEWLCERWASGPFKEQSLRNTTNRKRQKVKHTGGRKSFVRLMEEKGEEAPNMIAFYKETHWSKQKGKFINAASEHNYNQMLERLNEMESEEDVDATVAAAAASVFKEVLGFKSGYAQGMGHSMIPEPSPSLQKNKAFVRLAKENEKNKISADIYKTKLESLLNNMAALKEQFSAHDKQLNMLTSQLPSSRESQEETQGDA